MNLRTREQEREKKRRQRARWRAAGLSSKGKPITSRNCQRWRVQHPIDCLCYDCLWGRAEPAGLSARARRGRVVGGRAVIEAVA